MAMRPEVRRRAIVLIIFAIVQWLFMRYIVDNQLFNLTTYDRIVFFCISSLGGAFVIFVGLIYMVLKGNPEKE
ncbi:hypothetical protein [Acinetobacter portensis]|uniref:hypothetical protein n=1 Tax=Acinetobacter portensis TaxID=1839785 RepID=UPI0013D5CCE5|nr:hypothetical protein [Acinetobacter portensis]